MPAYRLTASSEAFQFPMRRIHSDDGEILLQLRTFLAAERELPQHYTYRFDPTSHTFRTSDDLEWEAADGRIVAAPDCSPSGNFEVSIKGGDEYAVSVYPMWPYQDTRRRGPFLQQLTKNAHSFGPERQLSFPDGGLGGGAWTPDEQWTMCFDIGRRWISFSPCLPRQAGVQRTEASADSVNSDRIEILGVYRLKHTIDTSAPLLLRSVMDASGAFMLRLPTLGGARGDDRPAHADYLYSPQAAELVVLDPADWQNAGGPVTTLTPSQSEPPLPPGLRRTHGIRLAAARAPATGLVSRVTSPQKLYSRFFPFGPLKFTGPFVQQFFKDGAPHGPPRRLSFPDCNRPIVFWTPDERVTIYVEPGGNWICFVPAPEHNE